MKVKCIKNNITDYPKLMDYAYGQDESGHIEDVTIGKEYDVYGIRYTDLGASYLVLTEEAGRNLPWWMPSIIYKPTKVSVPKEWEVDYHFDDNHIPFITISFPEYFEAEEAIIDYEEEGYRIFASMREKLAKCHPLEW